MISVFEKSSSSSKPITRVGGIGSLAIWLVDKDPSDFLYVDQHGDRIPFEDIEDSLGLSTKDFTWESRALRGLRALIGEAIRR